MSNVVAFQKPVHASISPTVRAQAIAFLLVEKDDLERKLARVKATLAECTGQTTREKLG